MALRRKAVAPQNEYAVLSERIERLESQVKALRQPGPSTMQAADTSLYAEPVPWETVINHPGIHTPAAPTDPLVYYHPGDIDIGGTTTPGFKAVGGTPLCWISVYDNLVAGNYISSATAPVEVLFPYVDFSENSGAVFGYEAQDGTDIGTTWAYRPTLLVDGVYSFGFEARSENASTNNRTWHRAYVGGSTTYDNPFVFPGQVAINSLSYFHFRDFVGFNQNYSRWGRTWTLPVKLTSSPTVVTLWNAILKQSADGLAEDYIEWKFWIVYHGPVAHDGNLNVNDDPGPP